MTSGRVLAGVAVLFGAVLCAATSCGPIVEPPGSLAPVNACPAHPCSTYAQVSPATCGADGACTTPVPLTGVELLISLPGDSSFAPNAQYVLPYERLKTCAPPQICDCAWPACGHLPLSVLLTGGYLMSACAQSPPEKQCAGALGFFLGNLNSGNTADAYLPVHATYRLLQDPWQNDVTGLPIQPIQAAQLKNALTANGPYGQPSIDFQAVVAPGTYERTIQPDPTYDVTFGPQVISDLVALNARPGFESVVVDSLHHYDFTSLEPESLGVPTLPVFDIARAERLDGWTAFLRDAKTKRTFSNVRPLSGTLTQGVQLVTNRGVAEALDNAELVVAPPIGAALPIGVFAPTGKDLPRAETYPPLPAPVTLTGKVTGPGGPVAADVVFEALAFTDEQERPNYQQFEFTGYASARPGQGPGGASTYEVMLPQGSYRVDVRPLDGSTAMKVTRLDVGAHTTTQDFALGMPRTLQGRGVLRDGRPLVAATVDALPQAQGCATPPALADGGGGSGPLKTLDLSAPGCLPRPRQTVITDPNGFFTLPLDPGGYRVRVRPADGTRLPWVTQDLPPGAGDQTIEVEVPAPFHTGFQLVDADGAPVVNALVRAFAGNVEIGETMTATDGRCDLYMALPP